MLVDASNFWPFALAWSQLQRAQGQAGHDTRSRVEANPPKLEDLSNTNCNIANRLQQKDPCEDWRAKMRTWSANMIFPKLQTAFLFSREIPWFGGSHRQLHRQQELSHDSYVGQLFVQVWLWPGCPVLTNCFLKFFTQLLFDLPLVIKQAWQWTIRQSPSISYKYNSKF